jgi:OmcA/MtrC family decaheme c-type cytochrome
MRVVALQSRFSQIVGEETIERRTVSVVKPVADDDQRRVIVDPAKCGNCHEWLQLHGGSRVVGAASDPTQPLLCVICHNPNLSSSGRTIDPVNQTINPDVVDAVGDDPLMYPERTQHFKNLVHGIHASGRRTEDFEFVRNRTDTQAGITGFYYDWSEVTFPGILNNCLTCHVEGTYQLPLPDGVLMSTEWTTTGDPAEDSAAVAEARNTVPNSTDLVNTPTASTCYQCHDSELAVAHMEQNGGQINVFLREEPVVGADFVGVGADALTRDEVLASGTVESCAICHGSGRVADLNLVHGIE